MDPESGHKTLRKGDTVLKIFAEHPTASQFYLEKVLVSTMDTAVSCNR